MRIGRTGFLIALLSLLLALPACGDDDDTDKTSTEAAGKPQARTLEKGSSSAGTYTLPLRQALALRIFDDRWEVAARSRDAVVLERSGGEGRILAFLAPRRVYSTEAPGTLEPVPGDLAAWLLRHPALEGATRRRAGLGGDPAARVDAAARTTAVHSESCAGNPCTLLFPGKRPVGISAGQGRASGSSERRESSS